MAMSLSYLSSNDPDKLSVGATNIKKYEESILS